MATSFQITVDVGRIASVGAMAADVLFPQLSAAVERLAREGVDRWQRAVKLAPGLWQGERDAYVASIRYQMTGPYEAEIVSDYKYVEDIETGRPAYDLKRMLDTSLKVRLTKKGQRYLIIPLRHNTPGNTAHAPAMPKAVYAEARQLAPSKITGADYRPSGTGAHWISTQKPIQVPKRKYLWGGSLPAGMAPKLSPSHTSDPYARMHRFANATGGGSTYLTFRTMGEWQTGAWIIAAKPGLFLAQNVAASLERSAPAELSSAMSADLA